MQIGSYQVLFELGRGGMGRVYLGRTIGAGGFERLVAIKRAHPNSPHSAELSQRFLNEARLAGFVHHANVVSMHQAGSDEEGDYLVCDYVEGESLAGLIEHARGRGKPPPAIVARILLDGLVGLHAAHEAVDAAGAPLGMLHRDVSMDNLLVGRDGVTRLSDFGIAKSVQTSVVTEQGMLQGKLIYFSPEYLRGLPVDRTIDVYAMGVTLWSALAGALPWRGREEPQLLHAILMEGIPPLPRELGVHPGFDQVIATACRTDPRDRFQTAREMHDALELLAKRSHGIASHVEVAEYVERVIGEELAARREKIRARRSDLEASNLPAALRGAESVDTAQRTDPMQVPVSIEGAFNPVELSTGRALRGARGRSRRTQQLVYAGVFVMLLAAGYAALALYSGGESARRAEHPETAAPERARAASDPRVRAAEPAPAAPSPAARAPVDPDEPAQAPPPPAPAGEELQQPEPAVSAPPASGEPASAPERPRAPERVKIMRREPGISTKNPYR